MEKDKPKEKDKDPKKEEKNPSVDAKQKETDKDGKVWNQSQLISTVIQSPVSPLPAKSPVDNEQREDTKVNRGSNYGSMNQWMIQ